MPKATLVAALVYPNTTESETERKGFLAAAQSVGQQLIVLDVCQRRRYRARFCNRDPTRSRAVLIGIGAFMNSQRERLTALAAGHAVPAIHFQREFAELGGLMSYGASPDRRYRQSGIYAGQIFKGEKPGDLPVVQATKFEFVINLKTAKALGLEIHPQLLAAVDEVIE